MFKNKAYMKMLIGTTLGALIITSALCFRFQTAKIDKLEDELYLKQQNEQKVSDSYVSILNEKTIQTKLNTLHEYPILKDCVVDMDHTYNYTSEGRMGIKKHITLAGHGQLQYSAMINFSTANLISSNNGRDFTIEIEAPYVDMNSIKLVQNTLVMNDGDYSFFANKKDGAQAQKLYMDSFVDSGINKIIEEYNTKAKQNYLEKIAKSEVHNLVRALNLEGNVNIYVKIIK
jgi:hypothetical protein